MIKPSMDFAYLFPGKRFVHAEMLAIEYREREIHIYPHRLGGAFPYQVRTQHLVGARERDGPFLVTTCEFLGRHVPVRVAGHGFGHHEREHVSLKAIG